MCFTLYWRETEVLTWPKSIVYCLHLSDHGYLNKKVQASKSSVSSPVLDEPQALEFNQQSSYVTKTVLIDYNY